MLQNKKRNRNEYETQQLVEWENINYQQHLPYANYFPNFIEQKQQTEEYTEDSEWKKRRLDSNPIVYNNSSFQANCFLEHDSWKKQAHEQHINYLKQTTANPHQTIFQNGAPSNLLQVAHQTNRSNSPNDQILSNQIVNQLQLDEYTGTYSQQTNLMHSQSTQELLPDGFITVTVKLLNGAKMDVMISRFATILDLKKIIERRSSLVVDKQRIIFKGRQVPDSYSVEECGIIDKSVLALVLSLHGG